MTSCKTYLLFNNLFVYFQRDLLYGFPIFDLYNFQEITLLHIRLTKIIYDGAKIASCHSLIDIISPTFQIFENDETFMKLCRNESGYCNNHNICYYFTIAGQERVNMISILRAEACHFGYLWEKKCNLGMYQNVRTSQ